MTRRAAAAQPAQAVYRSVVLPESAGPIQMTTRRGSIHNALPSCFCCRRLVRLTRRHPTFKLSSERVLGTVCRLSWDSKRRTCASLLPNFLTVPTR